MTRMMPRQWSALTYLARASYYLTITDRLDRELWALVENKLVAIDDNAGVGSKFTWRSTARGVALVNLRVAGRL
jgi:hypothetical protein